MSNTLSPQTDERAGANPYADDAAADDLYVRLSGEGMLRVEGNDTRDFLHRQFSTSLLAPGDDHAGLSSYSDPRGRVLAVPRTLPLADASIGLLMPAELIAPIRERLMRYALRARVSFDDSSGTLAVLGVAGQRGAELLADLGDALPETADGHEITDDGLSLVRLRDPGPRWLVVGPPERIEAIAGRIAEVVGEGTVEDWRRLDIRGGIPSVVSATSGEFVAQMLNLDRIGAIDFRKGCYPGQEIIARAHYLGRIKRRMFILDATETPGSHGLPPGPGAEVFTLDEESRAAGRIVASAPGINGGCLALAVVQLDASGSRLALGRPDGPVARVFAPPYGLGESP